MVLQIVQTHENNTNRHELFVSQLRNKRPEDRFGYIADYFSKNTFKTVKIDEL
ncbi:hypothetical protein HK102_012147 [Quaeritorhiza haematococci]|nr:hypothetical protein HK102_012147 [Quaeritorhiza haematococci]